MELAMQLSIQENPDYLDDMSYERLASLEDVKCTTKEETLANFKTTTFCSRRLRSNGREAHEEDWKVRRVVKVSMA